jgi:hypothetical protein
MKNPFHSLYDLSERDIEIFGDHLVDKHIHLEHAKETLIAKYPKQPSDGDGQDVEVYSVAFPAKLYIIKALKGVTSVNRNKRGFSLETSFGESKLSSKIAEAISTGMLGLRT